WIEEVADVRGLGPAELNRRIRAKAEAGEPKRALHTGRSHRGGDDDERQTARECSHRGETMQTDEMVERSPGRPSVPSARGNRTSKDPSGFLTNSFSAALRLEHDDVPLVKGDLPRPA